MFKFTLQEEVNHLGSVLTTEYEGFTHQITKTNLKGNTLVIAWLDGEQEYWVIENEEGLRQLHKLYLDLVGIVPEFTRMKHEDVTRCS